MGEKSYGQGCKVESEFVVFFLTLEILDNHSSF